MDVVPGLAVVIFDFDGTLYHLNLSLDGWREAFGGGAADRRIDSILANVDAQLLPSAVDRLGALELAGVELGRPVPEASQVVRSVSARYAVEVVSRNSVRCIAEGWRRLGGPADAELVGRESVRRPKPDPEGVQLVLARHAVAPAEAIVVGDSAHDVEAAHAAGVRCAIVANPKLEFRPTSADYYLNRLSDLRALLGVD